MIKYIITYALCLLAFVGCYSILGEGHTKEALIFQVLLFWLLNELWFFLFALPTIVATLLSWLRKRKDVSEGVTDKINRLTSVSLLLLPHGVFALLYGVNALTQGGFQAWLGLPLSQGLFASAYVGCVLLFVLVLCTRMHALSLTLFFEEVEEKREHAPVEQHAAQPPQGAELAPAGADSELQERRSRYGAKHRRMTEQLLADSETILYQTSPVASAARELTASYVVGSLLLGLGALVSVGVTVQSWARLEGWVLAVLLMMGGIFTLLFLGWVSSPLRRKRHRQRVDYFITNKRAIICEPRKKPRSIFWADAPRCHLALYDRGVGNIYLIERRGLLGKFAAAAEKVLGGAAEDYDETDSNHGNRLNGLIQVEQAQEIFALVERLLGEAQARS